jgi:hypothetical protein
LLGAGESVDVRTLNAVAAVRGSLLVAEAKVVRGVPHTTFTALQASVPIIVSPRDDPAVSIPLSAHQAVSISGIGAATIFTPVRAITPAEASAAARTAEIPRSANRAEQLPKTLKEKMIADHLQTADQLAHKGVRTAETVETPPPTQEKQKPVMKGAANSVLGTPPQALPVAPAVGAGPASLAPATGAPLPPSSTSGLAPAGPLAFPAVKAPSVAPSLPVRAPAISPLSPLVVPALPK